MKLATFLISHTALAAIAGPHNSGHAPIAWFDWCVKTQNVSLSRIRLCETITSSTMEDWLAAVRVHDCAAVLMLTSRDDPFSRHYGIDSEQNHLSITVDMLDETDLWRLRVDICTPESEYLGQWARFARGAGVPFRWLHAQQRIWRAYADGLRVWASEPSARKWLADLNAVDYTPMSPNLKLTPEDFKIPTTLTPEQARDSYFSSIYNPAFGVGLANGHLKTYGICSNPDEWSFDPAGLIQATLISGVSPRIATARNGGTHLVRKGLEAARLWHFRNGARRARWIPLELPVERIAAAAGSSALTCNLPPHNKINLTHDHGHVYIHPEIRAPLKTRPLLVLTTEDGEVQTIEITESNHVVTITRALAEIQVYIGDEAP